MNPYKYLILLFVPLTVVPGLIWQGPVSFLTPFCCFILLPLAELLPFQFKSSSAEKQFDAIIFRTISILFVTVVWLLILAGCFMISRHWSELTISTFIGICLSTGIVSGAIGFTLAHEFIHKHTTTEKLLGHSLLVAANYMHYSIEHIHGHHVYACTIKDPNSARLGESFYHFFRRSITGSYKNAWQIERRRLKKLQLPFISVSNRMLRFQIIQLTVLLAVLFAFGKFALVFFVGQSLVAILIHQVVNYIQHYGLVRYEQNGHYEKMNAHHSWSIPGSCKIVDLFQVQNHAHHHIHASTPFYKLTSEDASPKLPANYASMIVLSLIPPLWFKIIHPHLARTHN